MKDKPKKFSLDDSLDETPEKDSIEEVLIKSMALVGIFDSIETYISTAKKLVFSGEKNLEMMKFYLSAVSNSVKIAEKIILFLETKSEVKKIYTDKAKALETKIKNIDVVAKKKPTNDDGDLN